MIEQLEHIDRLIVLYINGLHTPLLDEVMWIISGKLTWIPLYIFLAFLSYKKMGVKGMLIFLLGVLICIAFSDLASKYLFKEVFQRYRPSHNLLLEGKLHFYRISTTDLYKGGQYGFVSSHAANFWTLSTFYWFVFHSNYKRICYMLMFVATLICFSRIYLGVHYLSDVFVGGLLGVSIAFLVYRLFWCKFQLKFLKV
jgi:undecaprenyl-diphosphatase